MSKMNFVPQIVFEKIKFKQSCNLIWQEYFHLQLENQIFQAMRLLQNQKGN